MANRESDGNRNPTITLAERRTMELKFKKDKKDSNYAREDTDRG